MSDRYNFRRSTRSQQVPPQDPLGSPRDPTRRIKLKVEDLDLDKSYSNILLPSKLPARPKKSRPWAKWGGATPLTDPAQLPRGWHMNEDDLHPGDIDGQIERCLERIAENIMPQIFQQRLEEFMASKNELEAMTFEGSEELSWETIRRVHDLEGMNTDITTTGDKYEQLPNINSLLAAYKSGQLEWHTGLVTYWSRGVQVSQPRRFDWDEFEAINLDHHGDKGFWTEGVKLALRLPGFMWFAELDFVHDTGASMMGIYQGDLKTLLGPFAATAGPMIPVVSMVRSRVASGTYITRQAIEVEVTILDSNRQRMTAWTRTRGWTLSAVPRLDGQVVRDLLYLGTSPATGFGIHISNTRSDLNLPDLDLASNPPVHNPHYRMSLPVPPPGTFAQGHGGWVVPLAAPLMMPQPAPGAPP
ncbi:hypothetical protein N7517_000909 [Penicillium concentricum]|uniref:Uncharacterized protein n=1 Tax=Penicillium concentricum TaxID=293559 RepID=A0A9W9SQW5_9EURO|nr:uncharacterized protein N7517_000909 [Penicillium concentricum]KAJ5382998.1 hypothetical protein N7517_000909 [Penicillium concentricum]